MKEVRVCSGFDLKDLDVCMCVTVTLNSILEVEAC